MTTSSDEKQREEWKEKIQDQKKSGLTVEKWCQKNKITKSCFYYWKNKMFPEKANSGNFIELVEVPQCKLSLDYRGVNLQLESTTLKQALFVLEKLACS